MFNVAIYFSSAFFLSQLKNGLSALVKAAATFMD